MPRESGYLLLCVLLSITSITRADHYSDHYGSEVIQTLGPPVVVRDQVGTTRAGQHGVVIPQPMISLTKTAILTNYTLHLRGTIGKVRLQIWRPTYRTSGQSGALLFYTLIGQTDLKDIATLGNGTHTFPVWPQQKIRLAPNDTFGLEYIDANPVTFSVSSACNADGSLLEWTRSIRSDSSAVRGTFISDQQYEFSRTRPPECRTYSIQLQLQVQECRRLRASVSGQVEQIFRGQRRDADDCWLVAPSDVTHITRLQVLQERSLDTVLINNCSFVVMEIRIGKPAITGNVVYSHCDIEHHEIPFDVSNKEIYVRLVTSQSHVYPEQLAISMAYSSKSSSRDCQGISADENPSYIQSPGFPIAYPRNQDMCWTVVAGSPARVRLEVQKSELEPSYSFTNDTSGCVDYVEIFDGPTETQPLLARWCGTTDPGMLTGSGSNILIRFYSGPYTVFPGFRLAVWAATEASSCTNFQASNEEQFLYTPGYPHMYRSDENVCWTLRASKGHRVQIKVYDSLLEGDDLMCEYDVAIIREGYHSDGAVLRRWCGKMVPHEPILTTGNAAHVSLYSDGSINAPGFYLGFSQVHTDACTVYGVYPYTLELSGFRLFTRTHSTECFTLETEAANRRVRLELLAPLKSSDCTRDHISVFDGPGADAELLVRWCGPGGTPTYVTSSATSLHVRIAIETLGLEQMNFRFSYLGLVQGKTDPQLNCCRGPDDCQRLEAGKTEGVLNSPTSDMMPFATPGNSGPAAPPGRRPVTPRSDPSAVSYSANADVCTVLEGKQATSIVLRVIFVQIEGTDGDCSKDYLEIRDGQSETSPLLSRLCGERGAFTLVTSGRFAYIRFVSNAELQLRGFQIRYMANVTQGSGCRTLDVVPARSLFTSPGFPEPYPSMTDICWVLKASIGSQVQIEILEFFVEEGCVDYLEIYDGPKPDSSLLTLICGDGKAPDVVTSTGTSLYIRFRSDSAIELRGFRIQYKTASTGVCQHIAVGNSVKSISSPNWPLPPPRSAEFCWVLTTPGHSERLLVTVSDSQLLQDSPSCSMEFVRLLDGPLTDSPPILRWCGDQLPEDMTTSGRSAYLHLVTSSGNSSSKGFVINFRSIPSSAQVAGSTSVTENGSNSSLPVSITWVIIASLVALIFLLVLTSALCYFYNRRSASCPSNSASAVTSSHNGNAIYDVPANVLHQNSDSSRNAQGLDGEVAPVETQGVNLNLDGSASFTTAFENPGYSDLPPPLPAQRTSVKM